MSNPHSPEMNNIVEAIRNAPPAPSQYNPAPFAQKKSVRRRFLDDSGTNLRKGDISGFRIEQNSDKDVSDNGIHELTAHSNHVESDDVARTLDKPSLIGRMWWGANTGEIGSVWTHPQYEGLGVASSLLEHANRLAGVGKVTKPEHSVNRSNDGYLWSVNTPENEESDMARDAVVERAQAISNNNVHNWRNAENYNLDG